jgi:hypothetical protein
VGHPELRPQRLRRHVELGEQPAVGRAGVSRWRVPRAVGVEAGPVVGGLHDAVHAVHLDRLPVDLQLQLLDLAELP